MHTKQGEDSPANQANRRESQQKMKGIFSREFPCLAGTPLCKFVFIRVDSRLEKQPTIFQRFFRTETVGGLIPLLVSPLNSSVPYAEVERDADQSVPWDQRPFIVTAAGPCFAFGGCHTTWFLK
jgi:hypothetical protein